MRVTNVTSRRVVTASPRLAGYISALFAADFLKTPPLFHDSLSHSRDTAATVTDYAGVVHDCLPGEVRMLGHRRVENLLDGTDALATQTGPVIDGEQYTLSFRGTGTVALSGAASGSLVGTGENDRVSLSATASSASMVLTVSGDVLDAQLERGDIASEYVSKGVPVKFGPNLIVDSAMNDGTEAWFDEASSVVVSNGRMAVTSSGNGGRAVLDIANRLTAGKTYRITASAEADAANAVAKSARLGSFDNGSWSNTTDVSALGVEERLTVEFVASGAASEIHLGVASKSAWGAAGDVAYFDNVALQEVVYHHGYGVDGVKYFDTDPDGNDLTEARGPELWPIPYSSTSNFAGSNGSYNASTGVFSNTATGSNTSYPRYIFTPSADLVGKLVHCRIVLSPELIGHITTVRFANSGSSGLHSFIDGVIDAVILVRQQRLEFHCNGTLGAFSGAIESISIREVYPVPAQGMLIEEARTNLATPTDDLNNSWAALNSTVSDAGDGWWKVIPNTTATNHRIYRSRSGIADNEDWYSVTLYAKTAELSKVRVRIATGGESHRSAVTFDLVDGTIFDDASGGTAKITPAADGYKLTLSGQMLSGDTSVGMYIYPCDDAGSFSAVGNGIDGVLVRDPQLELGTETSSVIRTPGTAPVTRDADIVNYDIGQHWDHNNGAIVVDATMYRDSTVDAGLQLIADHDGAGSERLALSNAAGAFSADVDGALSLAGAGYSIADRLFTAYRWSTDDGLSLVRDGVIVDSDPTHRPQTDDAALMRIGSNCLMALRSISVTGEITSNSALALTDPAQSKLQSAMTRYCNQNALDIFGYPEVVLSSTYLSATPYELDSDDPAGTNVVAFSALNSADTTHTWSLPNSAGGLFTIQFGLVRTANNATPPGDYEITVRAVGNQTGEIIERTITVTVDAALTAAWLPQYMMQGVI